MTIRNAEEKSVSLAWKKASVVSHRPAGVFAGFTLLEILVAITLVAMVTLIAVTAFRLTVQAWERGSEEGDSRQILSALPKLLENQLSDRMVLAMFGQAKVNPAQYFCGGENSLSFITAYAPRGSLLQGLLWVRYLFDPGQKRLLIYERVLTRLDDLGASDDSRLNNNSEDSTVLVSQIPGITSFTLAYTSEILYNPDDPKQWQNVWDCGAESNGVPMGLMMAMTLGEGPRARSYRWVYRTGDENSKGVYGGQQTGRNLYRGFNSLNPFGNRQ